MAMLDLTTFDQMVGAATDQTGPPVAGYIQACSTRLYAYQIERDQSVYWSKDFTANYFDTDFDVYGSFAIDQAVASSIVYLWGVSSLGNDDLDDIREAGGSWLSMSLQAGAGPTLNIYLQSVRAGDPGTATLIYTVGVRERYKNIYYHIGWDASEYTMTVQFYDDPACTITLPMTATTHVAEGSVSGLTHFFAFSSHNSASNGYDADVWTGNFYVNEAPPAIFASQTVAIPLDYDNEYDCTDEDDWTISEVGCTFEIDGGYVHLEGDSTNKDAWPRAYASGATTQHASVAYARVKIDAVYTNCRMDVFGMSHGTNPVANYGVIASIINSGGVNYIQILYAKRASGGAWSWVGSGSALAATSPYSNVVTVGHTYEFILGHTNNYSDEGWVYLYMRDEDGTGEAAKWHVVDSVKWDFGYYEFSLGNWKPADWETADCDMDYMYLGEMQGDTTSVGGEIHVYAAKKHNSASFTPCVARGGSGSTKLVMIYSRRAQHAAAQVAAEFMFSPDDGVTWSSIGSVDSAAFLQYDSANTRWVFAAYDVSYESDLYTIPDANIDVGEDVADHDSALGGHYSGGRLILSRVIESGYMLCGVETVGVGSAGGSRFAKINLSTGAVVDCWVVRNEEITNYTAYEPFVWRCSTDSDRLRMLIRYDDSDGTPRTQYRYFKCLLAKDATNEGADIQTGNATSYEQYKLVVSTADFTASNGSTRFNAVPVGACIRNTTTEEVGYVSAVAATKLTIVDADGDPLDLFPDEGAGAQNDAYEVTCWSLPYDPAPREEYTNLGGWLGAYAFKGSLYMGGFDWDSFANGVGPSVSWIAKTNDTDLAVSAKRVFDIAGARTPANNLLECGNGSYIAAQQWGNHYLDVTTGMGAVAFFMRLDAVDTLTNITLGRGGSNAAKLLTAGML